MPELADIQLPVLRRDLQFFPGPRNADGTPTFTVFDPLSERYSKIGWIEATILQFLRPGMNLQELTTKLRSMTTIRVTPQEIISLLEDAERGCFFAGTSRRKAERFMEQYHSRKKTVIQWLLAHYLFFCVPLLRPDRFLARTVDQVRFLASGPALAIYGLLSFMGVSFACANIERYIRTFSHFFNWEGLCMYGAAIIMVKCIHEFAHAYTARHFGANVRSMGVAFIVFWPRPFCDVTDSWKLASRRQRFLIALAGVLAELILAGCSLFFWYIAPEGTWRSIFFVLSSVTIASTLLVNLNPAMRYDGYYLLTDLSGVENLQPRAFAVTKWQLRKWLLGLIMPAPESDLTLRRIAWMMMYSIYTWIYRFFLYLGIAVLVYYEFTKALGFILFLTELWVFIAGPVLREGGQLMKMRHALTLNPRSVCTLLALGILTLWFCLPLERMMAIGAVVVPTQSQILYAPHAGKVEEVMVRRNDRVRSGQPLLRISARDLATDVELLEIEIRIIRQEIANIAADEKTSSLMQQKREELAQAGARLQGLRDKLASLTVTARLSGVVCNMDPDLRPGMAVRQGEILGRIADTAQVKLAAYIREDALDSISMGGSAVFVVSSTQREFAGTITYISPVQAARIEYPVLTSAAHGDIAVTHAPDGSLVPRGSYYLVEAELAKSDARPPLGTAGFIKFRTKPRSRLKDAVGYLWGLFLRESGF